LILQKLASILHLSNKLCDVEKDVTIMLNISKKLKATILTGMIATSMLGTTLVNAAGPEDQPAPPPAHHQQHNPHHGPDHDGNNKNNEVTAFVAGAVIGAVVGHNI
jgi:hypothetical protein